MYFRLSPRIEGIDILSSSTSRDIFGDNADGPKVDYFLLLRYIVIKLAARVHCMGRRCCYWTKRRWCPSFVKCNDHRSGFTHFIWLSGTVVQDNGAVLFDCSMLECALPIYVMLCRPACSLFHRRSLSLHRTMLRYLTHAIWLYTPHVPTEVVHRSGAEQYIHNIDNDESSSRVLVEALTRIPIAVWCGTVNGTQRGLVRVYTYNMP